MSVSEKLVLIAENEIKVFEAGKKSKIKDITPAEINTAAFDFKIRTIAENTIKVFKAGQAAAETQKATASGKVIHVNDVSSAEHNLNVSLTSDVVSDFSRIKVSRFGKNLFNINGGKSGGQSDIMNVTENEITVAQNLVAGTYRFATISLYGLNAGDTVTVSGWAKCSSNNKANLRIGWYDKSTNQLAGSFINTPEVLSNEEYSYIEKTGIIPEKPNDNCILVIFVYAIADGTAEKGCSVTYKDIQLEVGNSVTEYESFKQQTAISNADGTVEGLTSISPIMILATDNEDVTINLKYFKD
ncbi:MAG: hypothetical protein E7562_00760 [Ruminococcaceae bacterium]|nr:hypothetical protein [Oscillospiraceae bacterium]